MASTTHSGPDTTLYLYTSLTAGSSHIITATSRLETILKANKVAFRALDCATDEKARMLWSRRSKGRKLPGLVKFGQDLKEVEEWNEYGELNENIDSVSDIFGDTPMTDHPMAPPAPITLKDPLAKTSQPPSRSSSETRHISISDPKDSSPASSAKNLKDENPMSMAMRQAGAEAAAKAGQRKASAASSLKSTSTASAVPIKRDSTETTPTAAATKMSADADEPAEATKITAAKTPAQLAAEGAIKTSTDKIAETPAGAAPSPLAPESEKVSNEEQMLELRRSSSVTKAPSKLAQETSIEDVPDSPPETAVTSGTNLPKVASGVSEPQPRQHRGSSISEASKEEIREIEEKNAIKEEPEESEESDESDDSTDAETQPTTKTVVQVTDKAEAEVLKGDKTQEQKAKDGSAAGVSAAAALFLSPNHDLNPNRLSADSASVYSFFDSAFSPAPLFSGAKTLDLNLSFVQGLDQSDPRASTSTYGVNNADGEEIDHRTNGSEHDETPRQSHETQRTQWKQEQDDEQEPSYRESLAIAPLRTPARRQVSEPLLSSNLNRVSTPPSAPLPLNIRKSPTPTTSTTSSPSHSRTHTAIQTQFPGDPQPLARSQTVSSFSTPPLPASTPVSAISGLTSPTSPSASSPTTPASAVSESRSLRFKKSIRSLRSKKSAQLLNAPSPSPTKELPPNLPPQRQLKDLRGVSDTYATGNSPTEKRRGPEKSSVKNLLCF